MAIQHETHISRTRGVLEEQLRCIRINVCPQVRIDGAEDELSQFQWKWDGDCIYFVLDSPIEGVSEKDAVVPAFGIVKAKSKIADACWTGKVACDVHGYFDANGGCDTDVAVRPTQGLVKFAVQSTWFPGIS